LKNQGGEGGLKKIVPEFSTAEWVGGGFSKSRHRRVALTVVQKGLEFMGKQCRLLGQWGHKATRAERGGETRVSCIKMQVGRLRKESSNLGGTTGPQGRFHEPLLCRRGKLHGKEREGKGA